MPYIKPTSKLSSVGHVASSDSDYLSVDGVNPVFGSALIATNGGLGVMDNKGQIEILDALPMGRAQVRVSMGWTNADSDSAAITPNQDSDSILNTYL